MNRVTLELGGKSPQIVFADADLDAAANGIVAGVFAATGQTCMAGSRLIVHADVHDELVDRVAAPRGDHQARRPERDAETEMGPVANRAAVREGARLPGRARPRRARPSRAAGSRPPTLGGLFVRPTVLTGVEPDDRRSSARRSSGRCWPRDRLHHRGGGARAGQRHPVRPGRGGVDQGRPPRAPGGARDCGPARCGSTPTGWSRLTCRSAASGCSGLGRENGIEAVQEYTETKAVWVELTGGTRDPFQLG